MPVTQIQDDNTNKPIGYFSKKLSLCETRYSVTDKEALTVILTCRHFHHYLWGTQFTVITDHQPLTSIFKKKTKSSRMTRWILELREYDYNIQYIKGKDKLVADQLSRPVRLIVRSPDPQWLGLSQDQFRICQREDKVWEELAEYLRGGRMAVRHLPKTTLDQFALIDELV